ncbi:MAG: dihydroorotase [Fervidobacterium sp.]|uniref:dihydroorotase n=1 Tax=Fervidobacterium sp. TaxID=1871331 RepID=UPI00404A64E3
MKIFDLNLGSLKDFDNLELLNFPEKIRNTENLVISPPFVDLHTHVRLNAQEDYETLSKAAIAGGFAVCNIQPNTVPRLESLDVLLKHVELSKDKPVNFLHTISFFGQINDISAVGHVSNRITGFSTDGIRYDSRELYSSFATKKPALLFDHAQLHEIPGDFYIGTQLPNSLRTYSNEAIAIFRTVLTGLEFGYASFHIQHVSSSTSLEAIQYLRRFANVTCEVTPHHVFFTPDMISNPNQKINPPISKDREILREALRKGIINCFATDHAPHNPKGNDFENAPYGSSHIEVAFSVYYTVFEDMGLVLKNVTLNPLKVIKKSYEELGINYPYDAVLIDASADYTVDSSSFFSLGKNCAFDGYKLKGKVLGFRRNGRWVYWNGEFIDETI